MSDFVFLYPAAFLLFWLLPLMGIAVVLFIGHRNRVRNLYGLPPRSFRCRAVSAAETVCLSVTLVLSVMALSGPAWEKKRQPVEAEGRDVVFLVDVSQSMLARDLNPNRLIQAQTAIKDTVDLLEGDRAALVAFAGSAVVMSPLTTDYRFLRSAVDELSVNSVDRGGTLLGDALRKTMQFIFPDSEASDGYRDIILITDGEDQGSFPVQAAEEAGRKGVRLICIGLGDENTGTRVPVTDPSGTERFLMYRGKEVWSRLDSETLRRMAAATPGGKYVNISRGSFDLASIYRDLIGGAQQRRFDAGDYEDYRNEYRLFLFPALIAAFAALFLRRFG